MQASSEGAPFFLQGPREAENRGWWRKALQEGAHGQCLGLPVHLPKPPFRSHQPCVSQSGFSFLRDEGKVLREATELPTVAAQPQNQGLWRPAACRRPHAA